MSAFNDLDALRAARDARFRDSVARRIGCVWVLPLAVIAAVLYVAASAARAQDAGPPMHLPHRCDVMEIHHSCTSHCAYSSDATCYHNCVKRDLDACEEG